MRQTPDGTNYWLRGRTREVTRRGVLTYAAIGGAGIASAALVGCGGSNNNSTSTATPAAASATQNAGATPIGTVKAGGTIRVAASANPTTLDPQLSPSGADQQFWWPVHNNLVF